MLGGWVLAGLDTERAGRWRGWVLAGLGAGRTGCWQGWALAGLGATSLATRGGDEEGSRLSHQLSLLKSSLCLPDLGSLVPNASQTLMHH